MLYVWSVSLVYLLLLCRVLCWLLLLCSYVFVCLFIVSCTGAEYYYYYVGVCVSYVLSSYFVFVFVSFVWVVFYGACSRCRLPYVCGVMFVVRKFVLLCSRIVFIIVCRSCWRLSFVCVLLCVCLCLFYVCLFVMCIVVCVGIVCLSCFVFSCWVLTCVVLFLVCVVCVCLC